MRIRWQGKRNMRLKLLISAIILLAGAAISSWALGYGQNNNSDGLVLDIDFSEANYNAATKTFTDRSGNNNHAVSTNAAAFAPDKDGKSNGAMRFTTTNDEVVINHSSSYKTPSITVSFWYKPEDISKRHVIFTSWLGFTTEIQSGQFKWGLNGPSGQYYGSSAVTWNEWTYFTGTFDDATKQQCIYFNGVKKQCQTVSGSIAYNTSGLFISGPWDWIKGDFGNVKVYNRSLSEQEVKQLYNDTKPKAQIASLEKGLIGHWPLNGENYDAATNRVTDKSGYSRHCSSTGSVLGNDRFGNPDGSMTFTSGNLIETTNIDLPASTSICGWGYATSYSNSMLFSCNSPAFSGPDLFFAGATVIWNIGDSGANPFKNNGTNVPQPSLNTWHHYCVLNNQTTNKALLYLDGQYYGEALFRSTYQNSRRFIIGNYVTGPTSYAWRGNISDIRIYNRILSPQEISLLYERYAPPSNSSDTLQKGLILDAPLTSKYTKGGGPGSEVATDLSPFSRNGQCVNATLSADGAVFNGVNSDIRFGTGSTFFPLPKFAISVWFKSTGSVPTTGTNPGMFGFTYGLRGYLSSSGGVLFGVDDGSAFRYLSTSNKDYRDSQWHHFVGMNDGSNSYLYIDGNYIGQAAYNWNGTTRWPTDNFRIGRDNNDGYYHFLGNLRNLKIYNRVLSAQEVKTLYDRGRGNSGAVLNGL